MSMDGLGPHGDDEDSLPGPVPGGSADVPLKRLKQDDLNTDEALPWDLLDAEGRVILHRGEVLEAGPRLDRLIERGLYRINESPESRDTADVGLPDMLLAPGDILQLQTTGSGQGERYPVRLIGYHSPVSVLVSAPLANGRLVFLKEGQRLLVRGFVGRDAVGYSTRVLKSNLSPFAYLHLAWPDEVQTMRIRGSARVPVELVCAVIAADAQYSARMIDLSQGGARLLSRVSIGAVGDQVQLAFRINPGGTEIYLRPRALVRTVVDEQGQITTGVEFIDLSETDNLYLSNMVYQHLLREKL